MDKSQGSLSLSPLSLSGCQTVYLHVQVAKQQRVGLGQPTRRAAMDENNDRQELEKKLKQSRQLAADQADPVIRGWLFTLVRDLERRLQDQQQ